MKFMTTTFPLKSLSQVEIPSGSVREKFGAEVPGCSSIGRAVVDRLDIVNIVI